MSARGPDRMPPIPEGRLSPAQRQAAAELAAGPRGEVSGPFVPLLRSPELLGPLQRVGAYLRWHSALPPRLSELAILFTARQWTQQFEWLTHEPLARQAGLAPEIVEALRAGRRPPAMADDEAAVHDFLAELARHRAVADATYARALATLGERGVVDLCGISGYYGLLSVVMNVARTPLPGGAAEPLPPLPAGQPGSFQ